MQNRRSGEDVPLPGPPGQCQVFVRRLPALKDQIAAFCRRHRIRKLALFGSLLREDAGPPLAAQLEQLLPPREGMCWIVLGGRNV